MTLTLSLSLSLPALPALDSPAGGMGEFFAVKKACALAEVRMTCAHVRTQHADGTHTRRSRHAVP